MKFSFANGEKVEAFRGGKGICPLCGKETLSKCGNRKIWHWAHCSQQMCDNWWESETEWHRNWKKLWPVENQEVIHVDPVSGEKHIADVKNNNGVILEFQNSPIKEEELVSREKFYKTMVWIVNAEKFKNNIEIGAKLPNPNLPESLDMCIYPQQEASSEFIYYRHSEKEPDTTMVEVYGSNRIQDFIDKTHTGHYLFVWKKPISVWFRSTKPVLLDFGQDILWNLVRFNQASPYCLKAFSKTQLVHYYGGDIRLYVD